MGFILIRLIVRGAQLRKSALISSQSCQGYRGICPLPLHTHADGTAPNRRSRPANQVKAWLS